MNRVPLLFKFSKRNMSSMKRIALDDLSETLKQQLVTDALNVRKNSYSPYSNFSVGAAILTTDGTVYTGTNVENISFGLTCCAERSAVFNMVSKGHKEIYAIAISSENGVSPCGACRQVLDEFARPEDNDIDIILTDANRNTVETTLRALLPNSCKNGIIELRKQFAENKQQ